MKDLFLLTTNFPTGKLGEIWLANELKIIHGGFNTIKIFPEHDNYVPVTLPHNCIAMQDVLSKSAIIKLNIKDYFRIIKIVLSDFKTATGNGVFLKNLKYNLSLIKMLNKKALYIRSLIQDPNNTIIYSYWADNAATTASILKMCEPRLKVVTRAHGYEIYEDLKKDKMIPFRNFQNKHIDRFFSVSKRGMEHLKAKYPAFKEKYRCSYLGTNDHGVAPFNPDSVFKILTCCNLNRIKRVNLVPNILAELKFKVDWHIIGDGPEMVEIKRQCESLPKNINVVYHGHFTQEQVYNFYKTYSINVLLSVSYSEGLPVSMMEALSFGVPIIATDVGGCSEICNSNTGILIKREFNPKHVAELINDFVKSEMNQVHFREKCRLYWRNNFYAENNYNNFAEAISSI